MLRLTVAGTTYEYPQPGEDPNWGQGPTDWSQAVTDVLNNVLGPGDILETTFAIANNVSVAQNVNGFLFDSGTVRGADMTATIYRTSTSNPAGHAEIVKMTLIYDNDAASDSQWSLSQNSNGNSGVVFAVTDAGQLTYLSTDIGTPGYSGTIHFRASTLHIT